MKSVILPFYLLILICSLQAMACSVELPAENGLVYKNQNHTFLSYHKSSSQAFWPPVKVNNCYKGIKPKKYLMLALGPKVYRDSKSLFGFNFNQELDPDNCQLAHSLFSHNLNAEEKKEKFVGENKFIKECLNIEIIENQYQKIELPEKQPGCEIIEQENHRVVFSSGYCFIKIKPNQNYQTKVSLNSKCHKKELQYQNIEAALNIYTANIPDGTDEDLEAVDSYQFDFLQSPYGTSFPHHNAFDKKNPNFPTEYALNEVSIGKVDINIIDKKNSHLNLSFLVDNFCHDKSKFQSCNFKQPFAGEVRLYSLKNNELLKMWWDGGIAPNNWQGLIEGFGDDLPTFHFNKNQKYRVVLYSRNPKMDYDLFIKKIKTKIPPIEFKPIPIHHHVDGFPEFSVLPMLNELDQVPVISGLSTINFQGKDFKRLEYLLKEFSEHFNHSFWPPYYERFCDPEKKDCYKELPYILAASIDFEVTEIDKELGVIRTKPLKMSQKGKIVINKEQKIEHYTTLSCQ